MRHLKLLFEHKKALQRLQIRNSTSSYRCNYAMDKAYMRHCPNSENLNISFRYVNETMDRNFNFCRNINEKVDVALARIANNFKKELYKRVKKTKDAAAKLETATNEVEIPIQILCCGSCVNDITFAELLSAIGHKQLELRLLDRNYEIVLNEPWVKNLWLPTTILAGYVVYPYRLEIDFGELQYSRGVWFKTKKPKSGDLKNNANWEECGTGFSFEPCNDDVDCLLKFVLTPGNAAGSLGPAVTEIAKSAVMPGPGPCPFENRHRYTTKKLQGDALRVVSYNLLADLYADSDYSRKVLFPYCPPDALKLSYRKQLFLKEIIGYNADIVCLQEVDLKTFNNDLQPMLGMPENGCFAGEIAEKGTCGEGVATFYRTERFELLNTDVLNLGANITSLPVFASLYQKISSNSNMLQRICDRSTTLQLSLLKCKDNDRLLLVANTHLYFHPDADHIRLLQMGFAMLYVQHIYEQTIKEHNLSDERQLAIIFCGDFNSVPECGIYKLMTECHVDEHLVDWSSNLTEAIKNVSLEQPFKMQSACGTPLYTNFTTLFAACLDYIFIQEDRLAVQQAVPMPTLDELNANIAIPSIVFPSDHVAIVADIKFISP